MDHPKNFLVYRSSAGSGKTYTLVKEYLTLALKDKSEYRFRKILAITFTNKAAEEMKERVLLHLKKLAGETNGPDHDQGLLEDYRKATGLEEHELRSRAQKVLVTILHNYADLSISTIDRFVHRIIRTFSKEMSLSVDFNLDTDNDRFLSEAIERLLGEAGSTEELTRVLMGYIDQRIEDEATWDIGKDIEQFSRILFREDTPEKVEQLRKYSADHFLLLRKQISSAIAIKEQRYQKLVLQAMSVVRSTGLDYNDFSYGKSGGMGKLFSFEGKSLTEFEYNSRLAEMATEHKFYSSKTNKVVKSKIDTIADSLAQFILELKEFAEREKEDQVIRLNLVNSLFNLALLHEVDERLRRVKEEQNVILVSDFHRLVAQVVNENPAPYLFERLGERYLNFLIDEFQDTSVLQWTNFLPLIENGLASGNLSLVVGDSKQSIYRWRNGDMEQLVMLPKIKESETHLLLKEREDALTRNFDARFLDTNRRSKQEVIEFNNYFFANAAEAIQDPELKKIYDDVGQKWLSNKQGGMVRVELMTTEDDDALTRLQRMINECLEDGYAYRDIAVLIRENKEGIKVASFLSSNSIPVISQDSLLLGASPLVRFIIELATWLQDPVEPTAQVRLMEFYHEWTHSPDSFAEWVEEYKVPLGKRGFKMDLIRFWKDREIKEDLQSLSHLPVYQMLERLGDIFSFDKNELFFTGLLEKVQEQTARGAFGLSDLIQWWEEKGEQLSVNLPEGADAVTIMTIHKSKGLQFPVVIMPFADWRIRNGNAMIWLDLNEKEVDLPVALVRSDNTVLKKTRYGAILVEEESKSLIDNLNLLYVAFTRPEDRLYLIADTTRRGNNLGKFIKDKLPKDILSDMVEGAYVWGSRDKKQKEKQEKKEDSFEVKRAFSSYWENRIRISYQAREWWQNDDNPEVQAREYGNLFHLAASQTEDPTKIKEVAQRLCFQYALSAEIENRLMNDLEQLVKHPDLGKMFGPGIRLLSERDILVPGGDVYRPDRVVLFDNEAWVIDFKTGKPAKTHEQQVMVYGTLLEEMGLPLVRKWLFYTRDHTFKEVI